MKKWIGIITAGLLAFTASCTTDQTLKPYEGHWVDVNGNTTLDLSGSKLTITYGKWKETATVKGTMNDGRITISNANGEGLWDMSDLQEDTEGRLYAYEMVLDAEGHTYLFVREENLAKELEIQDLSEDLPKTIDSDVLTYFSLSFEKTADEMYGLDESWPRTQYSWSIERNEDGTYMCDYRETYDSSMGRQYVDEVSEEFVKELTEVIRRENLAQYNGYYKKNNVHRSGYSLYADYEDDEHLRIRAQGDAAKECIFDMTPLMNCMKPLLEELYD